MMKKKLLFSALAAGILGLLALAFLARWPSPISDRETPLAQSTPSEAPDSADPSKTASQPPAAPTLDAKFSPAAQELAALMSSPVSLRDGGSTREFQLSTTEVFLRHPDGAQKIVSLPSSESPETFAAKLEKLRTEEGVEPELVLYPVGFSQNEFTRRIATREVVITASSRAEADALAAANGLVFKKAPAFASKAFVYEAPTSAKAVSVQTDRSMAVEANPLLASRPAKMAMPNDPYFQLQWHLKHQAQLGAVPGTDINVLDLWKYPQTASSNYTRGQGVVIGIADDGMEWSHPDLATNVLPNLQWDWNQGDNDPSPYYIDDSHGTACAGVAAARGNNRIGVSGVAPEANLVGMRLISGPITDLDISEAMAWQSDQIDIKSNSWGYYAFLEDPVTGEFLGWNPLVKSGNLTEVALKYATDFGRDGKGTIITFAAGNHDEYLDSTGAVVKSGARMDFADLQSSIYTIAVGAVSSQRVKSNYSQIGSALVVSAPSNTSDGSGLGVMTTDNKGIYGYNPGVSPRDFPSSGDVTKTFGGTSSACPTVSGVIALMLQTNPNLGWRDVQEILIRSANRTFDPAGWTSNAAGIKFNYNYGAGLVDAAAAVALSANWKNLAAQTTAPILNNATTAIGTGANSTIIRTFTVPASLRVEHVTLALNIPGIKKGDLQIDLTSPAGTNSIFCEPHTDKVNSLDNWTFMSVRNWGENSSGNWTLTITNSGNATGNLTASTLTVFGTQTPALSNPLPVVSLKHSRSSAFLGTALTLNATAIDKNSNNTVGTISKVEFFSNNGSGPVSIGNSTSANSTRILTWTPPAAGTYTLTATATDGGNPPASATSAPVALRVDKYPVAAWDFDTAAQSVVPLATAIQSSRQYTANFGSNNATYAKILLDGSRGSSLWNVSNGELWTGTGSALNFLADANPFGTNIALLLRGGKNLSSNNKYIVFEIDMTNARRLEISYAAQATTGGFATHEWDYWDDIAKTWRPITDPEDNTQIPIPTTFTTIVLDQVGGAGFNNRANARVRLKVSGATAINGTNLLDNIRFNATVAP